jgi:hypothetical protein
MPLADRRCSITGFLEICGKDPLGRRQAAPATIGALWRQELKPVALLILPRHQRRTRGAANGRSRVPAPEQNASARKTINVGRWNSDGTSAIGRYIQDTEIISDDQNYVRSFMTCLRLPTHSRAADGKHGRDCQKKKFFHVDCSSRADPDTTMCIHIDSKVSAFYSDL